MSNKSNWILAAALVLTGYGLDLAAQVNCNVGVEHYPDGPLKQCVLNGNHTFHTAKGHRVTCTDGKSLVQHRSGAVSSCSIDKPHRFGELRCEAPARVEFDAGGELTACRRG